MWRRKAGRWVRRDASIGDETDLGRRPGGHLSLLSASDDDLSRWLRNGAHDAGLLDEALGRCEQALDGRLALLGALCGVGDDGWSEEPAARQRLVDLIAQDDLRVPPDAVWVLGAIEAFLRRVG